MNVSGDGLTYQWQRNGKKIPSNDSRFEGVFKAVLEINNAKVEDAGRYQCIVFNGARDNVTSNEATLTVSKLQLLAEGIHQSLNYNPLLTIWLNLISISILSIIVCMVISSFM